MRGGKYYGAVNLSTAIGSVNVGLNIALNAAFLFGLFGLPAMGIVEASLAAVIATDVQMALWREEIPRLGCSAILYIMAYCDSVRIFLCLYFEAWYTLR